MTDKVSVIVAVYNAERTIGKTLSCIENQTFKHLEIILVDDGSTDLSGSICDAFAARDPRARVVHKQNGGQASAQNAGMAIATGEYLFFPDSDDIFNLDIVRILHDAISKNPEYDIAICGREIVPDWGNDTTLPECTGKEIKTKEYTGDGLIRELFTKGDDRMVYCWNKLYRRELLDDIRVGDYSRHLDFDFNYRVFLRTRKAIFVDLPLYHWVHRSGSLTHQPDTLDKHYKCRTAIMFNNWVQRNTGSGKYDHLLLDALYHDMVIWVERSRKSGVFPEVRATCKGYRKQSAGAYLKSRNIPFFRKVLCYILVTFPGFSHFVMRITNNAR